MRLFWTEPANEARVAIIQRIAEVDIVAALAMDALFVSATERLLEYPFSGKTGRISGTRELVVHEHYVLVYETSDDTIYILMVLHTSRQWPPRMTSTTQ